MNIVLHVTVPTEGMLFCVEDPTINSLIVLAESAGYENVGVLLLVPMKPNSDFCYFKQIKVERGMTYEGIISYIIGFWEAPYLSRIAHNPRYIRPPYLLPPTCDCIFPEVSPRHFNPVQCCQSLKIEPQEDVEMPPHNGENGSE
jgi:hypothetical protein